MSELLIDLKEMRCYSLRERKTLDKHTINHKYDIGTVNKFSIYILSEVTLIRHVDILADRRNKRQKIQILLNDDQPARRT